MGREVISAAIGKSWCLKQEGQPFNNLGPHISPIATKWTKQLHSNNIVIARIIHRLIRDLETNEFLNFSILLSPRNLTFISQSFLWYRNFSALHIFLNHTTLTGEFHQTDSRIKSRRRLIKSPATFESSSDLHRKTQQNNLREDYSKFNTQRKTREFSEH